MEPLEMALPPRPASAGTNRQHEAIAFSPIAVNSDRVIGAVAAGCGIAVGVSHPS
jgi:hypothetical protein